MFSFHIQPIFRAQAGLRPPLASRRVLRHVGSCGDTRPRSASSIRHQGGTMPTIWVLQGANLNMLGIRQPEVYGKTTAAELDAQIRAHARERGCAVEIHYTNSEGTMIDLVHRTHHEKIDAIVMNPAGFTHAGYALRDAILAVQVPCVEVHISNLYRRDFVSAVGIASVGIIMGFGLDGYLLGIDAALRLIARNGAA
jgi:3-dehydroquinate dehydratase-2